MPLIHVLTESRYWHDMSFDQANTVASEGDQDTDTVSSISVFFSFLCVVHILFPVRDDDAVLTGG